MASDNGAAVMTISNPQMTAPRHEPVVPQDVAEQRTTMLAWERFVTGESLAHTPVDGVLLGSWQRSRSSGVSPLGRLAPLAADGDALERLRLRHGDLIQASKGFFESTAKALVSSQSIILLTDPDGIVLDAGGDMRTLDMGRGVNLMPGGQWREDLIGTNGIGLALSTGRPSLVHAAQHFCEGIKMWTCAAAPIRLPGTNRVMGVIDISGPPSSYQSNNLALAVTAARQIEAALSERGVRERMHLLEIGVQRQVRADAAGLMIVDRSGCICHLNGQLPIPGLRVGQLLPPLDPRISVDAWIRSLPEDLPSEWVELVRDKGLTVGALVIMPRRTRSQRLRSTEPGSETDPLRSGFAELLGNSMALRTAVARAKQLAGKRVPVLIQGETGVGKELFARAIHGDDKASGPFIAFNCGAATKELIADELFGHVRGAFTGANNEGRAGRFELAHGGTLCLDEIGELPLELQPMLLRALEEGVIYRLGDPRPRFVDVRLLAMTNRDLLLDIESRHFRRDLYHRISVTRLVVPPLRERGADVDHLVEVFNQNLAKRHGLPPRQFSSDILALLRGYSWPGNIRELRNIVESLLITAQHPDVVRDELPAELLHEAGDLVAVPVPIVGGTLLEQSERQVIAATLREFHGNLAQAARSLGISRSTLYRKVETYQLRSLAKPADEGSPFR